MTYDEQLAERVAAALARLREDGVELLGHHLADGAAANA